jgi:hypothetical protein
MTYSAVPGSKSSRLDQDYCGPTRYGINNHLYPIPFFVVKSLPGKRYSFIMSVELTGLLYTIQVGYGKKNI